MRTRQDMGGTIRERGVCCGPHGIRASGFSLLELAVALTVFAAVAWLLLGRLSYLEEEAEKATAEATISALKSALRTRMAAMMIDGRAHETVQLAGQNPFDWLDVRPAGYRGELSTEGKRDVVPGSWYFDAAHRMVIYFPRQAEHFRPDSGGQKRIRLSIDYVFNRPSGAREPDVPLPIDSVELRLLEPYQWF